MDEDDVRVHVWVTGRVQGVGYRASAWETATDLGLRGWVCNLPDGRVEAVFEGKAQAVEAIVRWCHHGPRMAIVQQVRVESEPLEGLQEFLIKR